VVSYIDVQYVGSHEVNARKPPKERKWKKTRIQVAGILAAC